MDDKNIPHEIQGLEYSLQPTLKQQKLMEFKFEKGKYIMLHNKIRTNKIIISEETKKYLNEMIDRNLDTLSILENLEEKSPRVLIKLNETREALKFYKEIKEAIELLELYLKVENEPIIRLAENAAKLDAISKIVTKYMNNIELDSAGCMGEIAEVFGYE
jgi:hypothetical protein